MGNLFEKFSFLIQWISIGKKKQREYFFINRKRDFNLIPKLYDHAGRSEIDDCTWNDLNMNEVFSSMDRTITTPGEQRLYQMLRDPLFVEALLWERGKVISHFQQHHDQRLLIKDILLKLGRTDNDVLDVLDRELKGNSFSRILYLILAVLFVLNVASFFVLGFSYNVLTIIALFIINMFLHFNMSSAFQEQVMVAQYLGRMINLVPKISLTMVQSPGNYSAKLEQIYKKCKHIGKKSGNLSRVEGLDVMGDYLNIMLLIKERNYHAIAAEIEKNIKEIYTLYNLVGELDALIAVSLLRESIEYYCEPEFDNMIVLTVEKLIHPLLVRPVPNSLEVKTHGIIITGSNMSGKSTFLRSIGVNALLAQTIYTCFAAKYRTCFYQLVTSISLNDNLLSRKSFYLGEAEAIQRIVETSSENTPCLGLIDEIFKGTNPVERVSAAAEILNYLNEGNGLTLVATHDLQLVSMINGYESYFFKEDVGEQGLTFDYKIHKGISSTKNAIKILEFLNYPALLIERIHERINKIDK
jgi:Mismatch repair ATPase (MutS family)